MPEKYCAGKWYDTFFAIVALIGDSDIQINCD